MKLSKVSMRGSLDSPFQRLARPKWSWRIAAAIPLAPVLLLTAACEGEPAEARGERGFYSSGRPLELIVPFGPGGGTDTWARLIAPHLQERLGPGAAIQVVNVPGAASVAGANEFALRRRPDGRALLVASGTTVLSYLLGEPMVRYDFRDFAAVLASPAGGVVYASPGLGIQSAKDLPQVRAPLVYGGISPTGLDLVLLLGFELLQLEVKTILGYGSRGSARLAFEQGETNIDYQTMPAYVSNIKPLVESGRAVPMFSLGMLDEGGSVVRDPHVPDLPSIAEVHADIFGTEPSGPAWEAYKAVLAAAVGVAKVMWIRRDAPDRAQEALRAAAHEMVTDSVFLRAARLEVGEYPFYVGDEAGRRFAVAVEISPGALTWLRRFVVEEYGVERLRSNP